MSLRGEQLPRRGEGGGLAGTSGALDEHERLVTCERGDRGALTRVQAPSGRLYGRDPCWLDVAAGFGTAHRQPPGQVRLDVQDVPRGQGADVLGHPVAPQQRHAPLEGAGGEGPGKVHPNRRLGHDTRAGDELLDLTTDVGGIPRRPRRTEPRQHLLDGARGPAPQPAHQPARWG